MLPNNLLTYKDDIMGKTIVTVKINIPKTKRLFAQIFLYKAKFSVRDIFLSAYRHTDELNYLLFVQSGS